MPGWVGLMDRLYLAAAIVALAGVVWWLTGRNDDLGDQLNQVEAEKQTIERIENAPVIDLGNDAARARELCRLAGLANCPM